MKAGSSDFVGFSTAEARIGMSDFMRPSGGAITHEERCHSQSPDKHDYGVPEGHPY